MAVLCLSENEKDAIVKGFNGGLYNKKELAEIYGVSTDTIRRVFKERTISPNEPAKVKAPAPREFQWAASSKFISITEGRTTYNADPSHPGFKSALMKLAEGKIEEAIDHINIERGIAKFVKGNVRIEDGALYYKDIELKSGLTERIISAMENGEDFERYLPFLENLMLNPSRKAVYRLFDFLNANDIEITDDGHFIGWKVVRSNYFDCASGKFDNSPGKEVTMPRNQVDEDDERTCSTGLHVCSKSYIRHFGSGSDRIVSVKVHPRDVVSIPVDYNDAKMRTCGYKVLEDVTARWNNELCG
ncbi:lysis inhibitor rIIA-rIIB membrane-associated [Klebsiella phage PWKp16]|uniref:Lysis inhibitor rIIA-rIIB membrane-associated n=1 Tax=Klebsiella phage AmPh_EK29 TaxID=2653641 RepID=A0A5P8PK01_9CAUD|nr:lysis inhibitor rIIA-rIIB membrane-associated [Klebsiella phage AmPh_EK29]UJD05371.1 lysis inhibitor rIIA-rIIB membrane-associated [Klebsiella phage PWKp16]